MIDIDVSVALPPSFESAQHIATAEKLGYRRAYLYDTPFEGDDVWLDLHRAAALTTTIELGPGSADSDATPPVGQRRADRITASTGAGARCDLIRHRVLQPRSHRPAADPMVVHGGLYPCLPGTIGRRGRRLGGRRHQVDAHLGASRCAALANPAVDRRNRAQGRPRRKADRRRRTDLHVQRRGRAARLRACSGSRGGYRHRRRGRPGRRTGPRWRSVPHGRRRIISSIRPRVPTRYAKCPVGPPGSM